MHELGVMMQVISRVEDIAKSNQVSKIDTLVLQIGELSSMIPAYIEACYEPAAEGTMLQDAKLVIEVMPGNGMCRNCQQVYRLIEHDRICPKCGQENFEVLSGKEFNIKEIVAY